MMRIKETHNSGIQLNRLVPGQEVSQASIFIITRANIPVTII